MRTKWPTYGVGCCSLIVQRLRSIGNDRERKKSRQKNRTYQNRFDSLVSSLCLFRFSIFIFIITSVGLVNEEWVCLQQWIARNFVCSPSFERRSQIQFLFRILIVHGSGYIVLYIHMRPLLRASELVSAHHFRNMRKKYIFFSLLFRFVLFEM